MSLFESGDSSGVVSLNDICDGKDISLATGKVDLRHLAELIKCPIYGIFLLYFYFKKNKTMKIFRFMI